MLCENKLLVFNALNNRSYEIEKTSNCYKRTQTSSR